MNNKTPGVEEDAPAWGSPADENEIDAWIERNRAPLEKLLAKSADDFVEGRCRELTLEEVLAESKRLRAAKRVNG